MSRLDDVMRSYRASRSLLRSGVEIVAVGDPAGARLNSAVRRAVYQAAENSSDVWNDLIRAANALRWRRLTQPQPNEHVVNLPAMVEGVAREARLLRNFVGDAQLVDEISDAADVAASTDSPAGTELLRAIQEAGEGTCVVVASRGPARAGIHGWLESSGVRVIVPSDSDGLDPRIDQSYLVGPPAFFPASQVTAPSTESVTFVMPAWFGNRSLPTSSFSAHSEGSVELKSRVHLVGDLSEPATDVPVDEPEDNYFPQPVWGPRVSGDREPGSDEVEAWKVLLGGGLAIWLDDGDRIRSLDPRQPQGERVAYEVVAQVRSGTYLVLREGASERGAMHKAAMDAMGQHTAAVAGTQSRWKGALAERLHAEGIGPVISQLKGLGVRTASRVTAWTDPALVCPRSETDFVTLLEWLGMQMQPSFSNAIKLRRALYQASADLRQELEDEVGKADLAALERDGFMRLELNREGFRGMIVARVLARSPHTEIVHRSQTRVAHQDEGGRWLE